MDNSTSSNGRKKFLPAVMGKTASGTPHAFHLEGYISKPPYFRAAGDGKDAYLGFSMGISSSPDRLMALADGTYDKNLDYGDQSGFVTVNVFDKRAEEIAPVCSVGLHVGVCGKLWWREYTTKSGQTGRELVVNAENVIIMGSRTVQAQLAENVTASTMVFTGKEGVVRSRSLAQLVTGEVIGCKPVAVSPTGVQYLAFGIKLKIPVEKVYALATGTYSKDKEYNQNKRILNVVVFRNAAASLGKVLQNGALVAVTGPVEEREYNGSVSYQMSAQACSIMQFPDASSQPPHDSASSSPSPAKTTTETTAAPPAEEAAANLSEFTPIDDDDDELPF